MLIDHIFNKQTNESAYGPAAGVETIRQLIKSVQTKKDIDLSVGPEQFPVRYDEARYLLSLWRANMEGGDKTADLFGDVNWVQSKLDDRDYRMGAGKLKDIDQERMKDIQKDKVLNLEYDSHNVGAGQYSDFEVMQAIKIAQDNEDNLTGAIEKIEAIKPGLSDHRAVKHELQKVNENCGKCPVTGEDECHCDDNKEVKEGTWHIPDTPELVKGLNKWFKQDRPVGKNAELIQKSLGQFIGDDALYDDLEAIAQVSPNIDGRSLVMTWINDHMPEIADAMKGEKGFVMYEGEDDEQRPHATQDYITKIIAKKITPGLDTDGEEFEDQAYLYHTSQLGRQNLLAKGGNWKAYYDAIKWWYKNMNESVNEGLEEVKPKDEEERQVLNMLRVFFDDQEGYQDAVAIDAVDYLVKKGLLKDFVNTLPYFDLDYEEFLDTYDKDWLEKRFGITEGMMRPPKMSYKGWTYSAEDEDYDDVIKISHSATKDGKEVSMDWSPYSRPTEKEFKLWIDLGMPTRKDVNSIGPLDNDDLMTLAKTKRGTAGLLQQEDKEDKEDPIDQSKLDAKTKVALKKAGLKYGAQTKGDPLASLVTFVADKDSEKTQDINRLDHENDEEEADIKAQDLVDKEHTKKLGNNDLQDKYQDQEIERLKQDLQKLLTR